MPIFEYTCLSCSHPFEAITLGSQTAACPDCGSRKLEKKLSVFAVGGGRREGAPAPAAPGGCGSCGDPRGPGACSSN